MNKIEEIYLRNCQTTSDINEHLPILRGYSSTCKHITEMGVRGACSTWAFLSSGAEKIVSYDIHKDDSIYEVIYYANEYGLDFNFIQSDVLKIEIDNTELLFIDTLHTYNQLSKELDLHSEKVSKFIILHDTLLYGFMDEFIYDHASEEIKSTPTTKQGIWDAVVDFLSSEKGSDWYVFEKFANNNGLTILKRKEENRFI